MVGSNKRKKISSSVMDSPFKVGENSNYNSSSLSILNKGQF